MNVYLDVATLLQPPFTWDRFTETAAQHQRTVVPAPRDARVDSLRALAVATSGRFSGPETLQVWTSDHIDNLVFSKAVQPAEADVDEDRGLGWNAPDAEDLGDHLVRDLVFDLTGGGSTGPVPIAQDSPPLSHEDGCVYMTAVRAGDEPDIPSPGGQIVRYCVTRDRHFREAPLSSNVTVLYPWEWVRMVRQRRFAWATAGLVNPQQ